MKPTKPNFGQRMLDLKKKKAQAAKDKEITDQFPQVNEVPMEQVIILPPQRTFPTEEVPQIIIRPQETPLERTIRNLREKSQGL
jgi:hypothetical protein